VYREAIETDTGKQAQEDTDLVSTAIKLFFFFLQRDEPRFITKTFSSLLSYFNILTHPNENTACHYNAVIYSVVGYFMAVCTLRRVSAASSLG